MKKLNRRSFLNQGAKGLTATVLLSQLPNLIFAGKIPDWMDIPVGFQTFPIREILNKDFPGTLKIMSGHGYKLVEMCSPQGYVDSGFGPLAKLKPSELKSIINDAGLTCPSCHFGFPELTDSLDDRIEFAHQLGLSQMICSTFWLPKTATLNDYLSNADKLNKVAEKIKKAGLQTGFHNHEFEFAKLDNQLIYDALMNRFDPDLVKMQFQTEVINLGYNASTYFNKYAGRFISSHLSDWTSDKKEVTLGQGIIDWKEFFIAAKTGGVKNFFVEMNLDHMAGSANYIQQLSI
jgi:sugar phosphate isomerase/epimerase